ncbi:PAS domain S-box-containing protein [Hydrogenispora ethanolica]|uniref:histidine kinase n=1 Tax=Hydrogenispora ethanolica TaxID=1082276 RepID=A0A4V2QEU4_HYDET|nr:PAS domain S-box protein [Hydrogenispora ethanolica]TCL69377.1 PAS domain S-box-containing protein [Hydrogenispora ethanolica]
MEQHSQQKPFNILFPVLFCLALLPVGFFQERLVVMMIEMTGVFLSLSLFAAFWNTREFSAHHPLAVLKSAFLGMACFDLLCLLSGYASSFVSNPGLLAAQSHSVGRLLQALVILAIPIIFIGQTRLSKRLTQVVLNGGSIVGLGWIGFSQTIPSSFSNPIIGQWIGCLGMMSLMGAAGFWFRYRRREGQFPYRHFPVSLGLLFLAFMMSLFPGLAGPWKRIPALLQLLSLYYLYPFLVQDILLEPYRKLKQAEGVMQINEERFNAFFDGAGVGILLVNPQEKIVGSNPAVTEMLGYEKQDFQQFRYSELLFPDDRKAGRYLFGELISGKLHKYHSENRFICQSGEPIWGSVTVSGLWDMSHQNHYAMVIIEDITKSKQVEEELAAEKERLAVTLRSIGEGVIATDTSGNIIFLNKAAEEIIGWSQAEAAGRSLYEVFYLIHDQTSEQYTDLHEQIMQADGSMEMNRNAILVDRELRERLLQLSGSPIRNSNGNMIGTVLVFHDHTEQQKIEEELFKAAKLESLGILAGGIAHDFNNILAEILANVQLARAMYKKDRDISKYLKDTETAIERATGLTKQLLTFAKGGAPLRKTASIANTIRDTTEFALRGTSAVAEFDIPDNLWAVDVDQGQISQVINNLVINAHQAMPNGGTIFVKAENIHVKRGSLIPSGKYVKLSIQDQGIGIPEEYLAKIFDPYFSTKAKGNGLGLATSYSIIKRHEGHIDVESKPGQGTCFTIYLPASEHYLSLPNDATDVFITGEGKVLLMDDDLNIRYLIGQMLEYIGYRVRLAQDGDEMLELYRQAIESDDPFDVVILDLTVPGGKGGREVIAELRAMDPKSKAIVSSGYSNDPVMADYQKYGFCGVVSKPYKINELAEAINKVASKKQLKLALDPAQGAEMA